MSGRNIAISTGQRSDKTDAYVFNDPGMEVLPVFLLLERLCLTEERTVDGLDAGPPHQLRRGKGLDKVTVILSVP